MALTTSPKYRFLLDFDHDGISDLRIVSAFQVNGSAVAGNFARATSAMRSVSSTVRTGISTTWATTNCT
jgi:hypothetical protein